MPPEETHCLLPVRHLAKQWRSTDKITRTCSVEHGLPVLQGAHLWGKQDQEKLREHLARAWHQGCSVSLLGFIGIAFLFLNVSGRCASGNQNLHKCF